MGKWAARLAQAAIGPTDAAASTDKTDTRGVLSVLAVTGKAVACLEPTLLTTSAGVCDLWPARSRRLERLLRWGWPRHDAEALAERLARRDQTDDLRVSCGDCTHYRPGRCGNHRRAGLLTPEVGRDLAALLQHCAGFKTLEESK